MIFEYRNSIFSKEKYIILEAELQLTNGNKEEIAEKMMHTDGCGRHPEIQPWDYNGVYSAIMQLREAIEDMM